VKICDFGITKRAEEGLGASSTLKGTIGFLAPELHGFVKVVNKANPRNAQAADMWALGEIAFQMLTKEQTFKTMLLLLDFVNVPGKFPSHLLSQRGVSIMGRDFIKSVMIPTPEDRLTAKHALRHDWVACTDLRPPTVFNRYEEFRVKRLTASSNRG
jgi:serine/threonine protein kinase